MGIEYHLCCDNCGKVSDFFFKQIRHLTDLLSSHALLCFLTHHHYLCSKNSLKISVIEDEYIKQSDIDKNSCRLEYNSESRNYAMITCDIHSIDSIDSMDCMIDKVEEVQQHPQISEAPEPATDPVIAIDTLTEGLVGISVVVHEFQKDINEINQRLDRIQEIIKHNHAVCENTQIKIGISWKRLCKNIRENFLNR